MQATQALLHVNKNLGDDISARNQRLREMTEALRSGADVNAGDAEVSHAKQVQGEHTEHCAVKQVNHMHTLMLSVNNL